eukprot:s1900_g6.t1
MSRELARSIGVHGHQWQWRKALHDFEDFRRLKGREPAVVAQNALLVALGRGRQLHTASKLLLDLRQRNIDVDLEAYGGLVSACGDRWQEAFGFLQEALGQRFADAQLFHQALAACGDWEKALDLLRRMDSWHLSPGLPAFGATLSCLEDTGLWNKALDLLEEAWSATCPPNRIMYNSALRSCASGHAWEALRKGNHP